MVGVSLFPTTLDCCFYSLLQRSTRSPIHNGSKLNYTPSTLMIGWNMRPKLFPKRPKPQFLQNQQNLAFQWWSIRILIKVEPSNQSPPPLYTTSKWFLTLLLHLNNFWNPLVEPLSWNLDPTVTKSIPSSSRRFPNPSKANTEIRSHQFQTNPILSPFPTVAYQSNPLYSIVRLHRKITIVIHSGREQISSRFFSLPNYPQHVDVSNKTISFW